jgi:hypothetical protein
MHDPGSFSRRAFLARVGVLGAVVGAGGAVAALPVWAKNPGRKAPQAPLSGGSVLQQLVALIQPALASLAHDTLNGLVAFALPGSDAWSAAQGTPHPQPGAVQARGAGFMAEALDHFVPFPDQLGRPLAAAFSTALAGVGLPLPNPLGVLPVQLVDNVDSALSYLLQNDETIPLSLAVALLLNLLATQVDPKTVTPGPDLAPFSRLSFADKARAFQLLEETQSDLVAALDVQVPAPLRESVSGLFKYVGGSLLEFAAFGSFSEWAVFDRATRQLHGRPVGWQLSGYSPNGVVDGWDDLKGYYQGRRQVADV